MRIGRGRPERRLDDCLTGTADRGQRRSGSSGLSAGQHEPLPANPETGGRENDPSDSGGGQGLLLEGGAGMHRNPRECPARRALSGGSDELPGGAVSEMRKRAARSPLHPAHGSLRLGAGPVSRPPSERHLPRRIRHDPAVRQGRRPDHARRDGLQRSDPPGRKLWTGRLLLQLSGQLQTPCGTGCGRVFRPELRQGVPGVPRSQRPDPRRRVLHLPEQSPASSRAKTPGPRENG